MRSQSEGEVREQAGQAVAGGRTMKRSLVSTLLTALLGASTLLAFAGTAQAAFGIAPGSFEVNVLDSAGTPIPVPQAGSHPSAHQVRFEFNTKPNDTGGGGPEPIPDEAVKDVEVELPPGLVGSPAAIPPCSAADFVPQGIAGPTHCPTTSQVGVAYVKIGLGPGFSFTQPVPVYNLNPSPGAVATLGFVPSIPVTIDLELRTGGDYGITAISRNTSQGLNIYGVDLRLWGVPSAAEHNAERYLPGRFAPGDENGNPLPSGLTPTAFLDLPSQCGVPRTTRLAVTSWQAEARDEALSAPQVFGDCDEQSFEPSVRVQPDSSRAGAPTGLSVDVRVPQSDNPNGRISPPVKDTTVTLPRGMAVNASSANGLEGCSPAEADLTGTGEMRCPAASRVGTVEIETPLLGNPVEGSVYLADQGSNPFNSLLALYVSVVEPETGAVVKLAGRVSPDPQTGQLTATFADTPQLQFETLHMHLKGGENAPLVLPAACGTYTAEAVLSSWAEPDSPVTSRSSFSVSSGCSGADRFDPGLTAGTLNPIAGSYSPFLLRITREDGEQNLAKVEATLPEGLLAKLKGVPPCDGAVATAGNCPAASQVGRAVVGAGSGSEPVFLPEPGKAPTAVYLGGPYKGAPYSLVVKVPAQAGPFDLGNVVVRNALRIDPVTTRVTAESDPLPQILQGIPVAYRDLRVEVDRKGFMLNPTNCREQRVTSTLTSAAGQTASPADRFAVAGCRELGFGPSLNISLKGKMNRTGNPALKAVLKMPKSDQANIAKTTVVLPKAMFIDNAHINNPCTRVQFDAGKCPGGSILGRATAYTPLLDKPLTGPVYFRSNGGDRELPDLVVDLKGQIHVTLVGFIDSVPVKGTEATQVRTRFQNVPDAPVSRFVLNLKGGKKGLIENSENLCSFTPTAKVQMTGQNGKTANSNLKLGTSCGKK
ncbi:MAG: hypothetical protein ACJ76B_12530 [Solirubrobacterales bacterium]